MIRPIPAAAVAFVLAGAVLARAEPGRPAEPGAPAAAGRGEVATACEPHLWPAERFQSLTTGWLGGGLIDAAIHADRDRDNRTQMAATLDPAIQPEALGALDLATLQAAQPSRVILHDTPLNRKTVSKVTTRRADSASPCHAEVIAADMLYQKNVLPGRTLQTLFPVRDFGERPDRPRVTKAWGGEPLTRFPPREGEDIEAAAADLAATIARNFKEVAAHARRAVARAPAGGG